MNKYIRIILVSLSLGRCAGIPSTESVTGCPTVEWIYHSPPNSVEDDAAERTSKDGCIRHYGQGACLVRMIKRSELNYWAICRRANGSEVSE